jgi:hypothetical protein
VANESKDLVSNPLPLVAVALLAAGVLVRTLPLESARPNDAPASTATAVGEQDVRARLWQDPFEVVLRNAKRETPDEQRARAVKDPLHEPGSLTARFAIETADPGAKVTILAVMVFGTPYAEDVEARRRMRYAVLSGLAARHYVPDNPGALGYIWTDSAKLGARVPEVVPYEWFSWSDEGLPRSAKVVPRDVKTVPGKDGKDKVLVLWLAEDAFGKDALRGLAALTHRIACDADAAACLRLERNGAAKISIIGPAGSGTLKSIYDYTRQANPDPWHTLKLHLVSPFATVPQAKLGAVDEAWGEKLNVLRAIGGDDDLAQALVEELALRRVNAPQGEGKPACTDGIVLVSEWDTDYGRSAPVALRDEILSKCQKGARVWWFSYLRGLDGALPGAAGEGARKREAKARDPSDAEELLANGVPRDRSEGRSQFDYLRRIGERVRGFDEAEKAEGRPGVRAIGVLGSDVYDKLLVLQALRPMFPDAVFFTTDMDARLLHPDQNAWARNLVVASHYGLALHSGLQRDVPPFRDGYQTAAFMATLMTLAPARKSPGQEHVGEWLAGSLRPASDRAGEGAFDYDPAARPRVFAGKKLFEIGRTRAVELDANGAGWRGRCDRDQLPACTNVHPRRDRSTMGPDLSQPQAWLFAGGAAAAFILLLLTSRAVRDNWKLLAASAGVVGAAFAALRWVIQLDVAGSQAEYLRALGFVILAAGTACGVWLARLALEARVHRRVAIGAMLALGAALATTVALVEARPGMGEPMAWAEGISTWPTEYLRLAAILLGVALLVHGWATLRRQADSIQRAFFLGRPPREGASPCAARPALEALRRIGQAFASGFPPVDDYFRRADDGAPKVDATALWHRYRRRTEFWPSAGRIATGVALALAAGALVLYLDPPSIPARGAVAYWTHQWLQGLSVVVLVVLIFSVVDATRMSTGMIDALAARPTLWPWRTRRRFEARSGVPAEHLDGWIDFEFMVALTRGVNRFIYYPFAVLLLLIVSRSTVFDAWDFPLPLLALLAAAALYATWCALSLRRAAEAARKRIVACYEDECLRLDGTKDVANGRDPSCLAKGLCTLVERMRATREAAFLPLTQQPAVRALLIPFGGFGGVSLIEYLVFAQG